MADQPANAKEAKVDTVYCSFCSKSQHDVLIIIAGPACFICDECVELCLSLIEEKNPLANRYMVGPAITTDQLRELIESGFTTADLLAGAGILCTNEATLVQALDVTLSKVGAVIKNRLAEFGGEASLLARIAALEKHNEEESVKMNEKISRYREHHMPVVRQNNRSIDTLRERLERLQSAKKPDLAVHTKAEAPTSPPLES